MIMEFFIKYLWWIGWLVLTPFVLFCGVVYYILITFDEYKLNDWDNDDLDSITE